MRVPEGHILLVGLGRSGKAVADFLVSLRDAGQQMDIVVVDGGDTPALHETSSALEALGVKVRLAAREAAGEWDLVVASPGVPPSSPLLSTVAASGAPVISEIELAYAYSSACLVAVTGTNGKTTVTSMIAHLLDVSGIRAEPAGNIGPPAIDVAPRMGSDDVLVVEASSFHLARIVDFHPAVSVLLNITDDHRDWHGTFERYMADKGRIFENQRESDLAVIVLDDPGAAPFAKRVSAAGVRVSPVSLRELHPGGASVVDGVLTLSTADGTASLLSASDLRVKGVHNLTNALAAAVTAHEMGASPALIAAGLATFEPLEHRLEPAGHVDGVEYFDDSKATNPDAAAKALTAFEGRSVVLLLGGSDKGSRFDGLAPAVSRGAKCVIVFGDTASRIEKDLQDTVPVERAVGLGSAVAAARRIACPGDVVLLSPACASYDEFSGFAERGEAFKEMVAALAREAGEGNG